MNAIRLKIIAKDVEKLNRVIEQVNSQMQAKEADQLDAGFVQEILKNFNELFSALNSYEQQLIVKNLVNRIRIVGDQVELEILGNQYISPYKKNSATMGFTVTDDERTLLRSHKFELRRAGETQ